MENAPPQPRPRGRPKTETDEDRQDKIRAGAMQVFVEKGFANTTMQDIARQAGVSKRDLYQQFADKTALFTDVIQSRRGLILDLPRPPEEVADPLTTLVRIFRLDLDEQQANERDALMRLISRESLLFPDLNAMLYDTGVLRSREALIDWLDHCVASGALPPCHTARLAGMLMDVVFGALLPRRQRKGAVDRAAQTADIRDRIAVVLAGFAALGQA